MEGKAAIATKSKKQKKQAKPAQFAIGQREACALEEIFQKASEKISPPKAERDAERAFAKEVSKKLERALGKIAKVTFVGSAARDTGLRGDRDIDLFAVFPQKYSRDEVVKKTFGAAKRAVKAKWITRYAEHPYLQTQIGEYKLEVIPCFAIAAHAPLKSAVDRSPLHMEYLQSRLAEIQKRDVRVLKQLLRNNGIYGAELQVEGFSGLVCEHLILNYHSLLGLVENAAKWKPPVVIDIEGAHAGDNAALLKKFPSNALILIDAVDKNRNAAAAISATNVSKFIATCRELAITPNEKMFFSKPQTHAANQVRAAISRRVASLFLLKAKKPDLVADVLFPQLKKTSLAIARHLALSSFRVYDSAFFDDEKNIYFLFELEEAELPAVRVVQGPPVSDAQSFSAFVSQCRKEKQNLVRGPYIRDARVFADKKRVERHARGFLKKIMARPEKFGAASHVAKALKRGKLFEGKTILSACAPELAMQGLGNYFFKKEQWL